MVSVMAQRKEVKAHALAHLLKQQNFDITGCIEALVIVDGERDGGKGFLGWS